MKVYRITAKGRVVVTVFAFALILCIAAVFAALSSEDSSAQPSPPVPNLSDISPTPHLTSAAPSAGASASPATPTLTPIPVSPTDLAPSSAPSDGTDWSKQALTLSFESTDDTVDAAMSLEIERFLCPDESLYTVPDFTGWLLVIKGHAGADESKAAALQRAQTVYTVLRDDFSIPASLLLPVASSDGMSASVTLSFVPSGEK